MGLRFEVQRQGAWAHLTMLGLERERDELAAALSRRRERGEDGLTQAHPRHDTLQGQGPPTPPPDAE